MQRAIFLGLMALLMAGCKHSDSQGPGKNARPTATNRKAHAPAPKSTITVPLNEAKGKVAAVILESGFVVIDFTLDQLPKAEQRMHVYRQGQKVGEVKISREANGGIIAADIMAGEVKVGDEVRAN